MTVWKNIFSEYKVVEHGGKNFLSRVNRLNTKSVVVYNGKEYSPKSLFKRKTRAAEIYQLFDFHIPAMQGKVKSNFSEKKLSDFLKRLHGDYVLKPDMGVGSHGVKYFSVDASGKVESYITKSRLRTSEFFAHFQKWDKYEDWIVEELLLPREGATLIDYKFYAFKGMVPLVLAKKNVRAYRWFNNSGESIITGRYSDRIDESIPLPENFEMMLKEASRISASLPFDFCRVDMFDASKGIVLGELTPQPARPNEEFDEYWESLLISYLNSSSKFGE